MNNEIKEMLELHIKNDIDLLPKNQKTVLDYITNLQQELETRQYDIDNLTYMLAKKIEEKKYLEKLRNANYLSWQDSLSRIEKAINKVQNIIDIGFDYDGYNDVENLKILVDELVDLARQTKNILNGDNNE